MGSWSPHLCIPHKANLVEPRLPFGRHFFPISALCGNPPSKSVISFVMEDRYATVPLSSLELQKDCKALLPAIIFEIPNKSYRVQASSAFRRYVVYAITLNGYP